MSLADFQMVAWLWSEFKLDVLVISGRRRLTENQSEEKGLPASKVTKNGSDSIRLSFGRSSNSCHSLSCKFNLLIYKEAKLVDLLARDLSACRLTRSEKSQLGFALPGVSGRKK